MAGQTASAAIQRSVAVTAPVERAFAVFTDRLADWWPREFTWSQDVLGTIAVEPRAGGRCYERGPYGFSCDWGRVLAWEPPNRLVIAWQISPHREPEPNPAKASEVEVRFVSAGPPGTRVELEHRHLDRHGRDAEAYRAGLDSPEGWTYILNRFAAACS